MRIALTGATGFLGRYIVRELASAGHRIRCWYRPSSDRGGLEEFTSAIDWRPGSLGDQDATVALVQDVDAVVHSALQWDRPSGSRSGSEDDLLTFVEANLLGSLRLFHAAYTAGVPRVVFISTCAVHERILDDRPLDETHPLWPTGHYGAHKGALEKFVHSYGFGKEWPICSLRPTGIYGLAHPPRASRWYDLVGRVVRGEAISSARGGKEVHAADVAKAVGLLLAIDAQRIAGQAFNCYDQYISEEQIARIAREIAGSPSHVGETNRGPKHQIDTTKIRGLGMTFGGEPLLRQTVAELVNAVVHDR
jgi:nucleoside-diphosphate-sugar epimerase